MKTSKFVPNLGNPYTSYFNLHCFLVVIVFGHNNHVYDPFIILPCPERYVFGLGFTINYSLLL